MEINDSNWFVKNLSIDSSLGLFLTIKPNQYRKLGKAEHLFYDRLAKNLTRADLIPWLDSPTVNKGLFVIPLKQLNGKTSIEGTVIGPNIKYPVENAFVVLEKNGLYVRGAFTNREGRFYMDTLLSGTYMLKVKSNQYHYWLHYSLEIKGGFNYLVQVEMKPYSWLVFNSVNDTVQNWMAEGNIGYFNNNIQGLNSNASPSYSYSDVGTYGVTLSSKELKKMYVRHKGIIPRNAAEADGLSDEDNKAERQDLLNEVSIIGNEKGKYKFNFEDIDGENDNIEMDSMTPKWNKTKQKAEEDEIFQ